MSRILGPAEVDSLTSAGSDAIPANGTIALWLRPHYTQDDGVIHFIVRISGGGELLEISKEADNDLNAGWFAGAVDHRFQVIDANYTLREEEWNSFILTWNDVANETRLELNGTEIGNQTATLTTSALNDYVIGNLLDLGITQSADADMSMFTIDSVVWTAQERAMFHARVHPCAIRPPGSHLWMMDSDSLLDSWGAPNLTVTQGVIPIAGDPTLTLPGRNLLIKRARFIEAREAVGLQAVGR